MVALSYRIPTEGVSMEGVKYSKKLQAGRIYPSWIPNWALTAISFSFLNRWGDWLKYRDFSVIWLGTEISIGDAYGKWVNWYGLDITIANFAFKINIGGFPHKRRGVNEST